MEILQPPGWLPPKGYANGVAATGKLIFVAGQVGWNRDCVFESDNFIAQADQALANVVAVLAAAGAGPAHVTRMTWYVTDREAYLEGARELGQVYRRHMGTHYPAMTLIQVAGLAEARARIEIEVTAVLPQP